MTNKSKNKGKMKKGDTLFSRWKSDPYLIIINKIIEKKFVSKKTPKIGEKYDLRNVNLRKRELEKIAFKDSCLDLVCGYNMNMKQCDLGLCLINKGDFELAQISNTNFEEATLNQCIFKKASLSHVSFEKAKVIGCDFTGAKLEHINVQEANLDSCIFNALELPEEIEFIGIPASANEIIIDALTLSRFKESPFKTMIEAANLSVQSTT